MEKKFELREIQATDIVKLTTIFSKIGIKEFKALFEDGSFMKKYKDKETTQEEKRTLALNMGLDVANIILGNLEQCEEPLYKFLAGLTNKEVEEIKHMKGNDFIHLVMEVFTKEEFKDFFKGALKSQK